MILQSPPEAPTETPETVPEEILPMPREGRHVLPSNAVEDAITLLSHMDGNQRVLVSAFSDIHPRENGDFCGVFHSHHPAYSDVDGPGEFQPKNDYYASCIKEGMAQHHWVLSVLKSSDGHIQLTDQVNLDVDERGMTPGGQLMLGVYVCNFGLETMDMDEVEASVAGELNELWGWCEAKSQIVLHEILQGHPDSGYLFWEPVNYRVVYTGNEDEVEAALTEFSSDPEQEQGADEWMRFYRDSQKRWQGV